MIAPTDPADVDDAARARAYMERVARGIRLQQMAGFADGSMRKVEDCIAHPCEPAPGAAESITRSVSLPVAPGAIPSRSEVASALMEGLLLDAFYKARGRPLSEEDRQQFVDLVWQSFPVPTSALAKRSSGCHTLSLTIYGATPYVSIRRTSIVAGLTTHSIMVRS